MSNYVFRLRENMPPGFTQNDDTPELPAVHEYLKQFDGNKFESQEEFRLAMKDFPQYINQKNVPVRDRSIREGIYLTEEGKVGVFNDDISEWCTFGRLEEIIKDAIPVAK